MARSLIRYIIYVIIIILLLGLFKITKLKNMIEVIKSEEIETRLTETEINNISALASATLNSTNQESDLKCPEFKHQEIFSENLLDSKLFNKDFKNNEFNKRYLRGAMQSIRQAARNSSGDVKLVRTVTIIYKGVTLKFPFAFE